MNNKLKFIYCYFNFLFYLKNIIYHFNFCLNFLFFFMNIFLNNNNNYYYYYNNNLKFYLYFIILIIFLTFLHQFDANQEQLI